jgi:hypothetical protein
LKFEVLPILNSSEEPAAGIEFISFTLGFSFGKI